MARFCQDLRQYLIHVTQYSDDDDTGYGELNYFLQFQYPAELSHINHIQIGIFSLFGYQHVKRTFVCMGCLKSLHISNEMTASGLTPPLTKLNKSFSFHCLDRF